MRNKHLLIFLLVMSVLAFSCHTKKQKADLIVYNAHIYTVDSTFSVKDCIVINSGLFIDVGTKSDMLGKYDPVETLDLKGKYIYPGFIDAHCHFYGYAVSTLEADLSGTASFDEVLQIVAAFHKKNASTWIKGRGWDQNDWSVKEYPDKTKLDLLFPDNPVLLIRIDGHAAITNSAALKIAGVSEDSKIKGGIIELENGEPTGILIDNAIELVSNIIPRHSDMEISKALTDAAEKCFSVGLTSVGDAGLDKKIIHMMDSLQKEGLLKMKVYAMMNPTEENFKTFMYFGRYKSSFLNVRSVKLYADGALGSRGACLLEPYSDKPESYGLMVSNIDSLKNICAEAFKYGYQVNTHAIGDSAVRTVINLYAQFLKGTNDLRWRIEHSQIVDPVDLKSFSKFNIIPSVNMIHATSDMYWAKDRLDETRIKYAYAYNDLLKTNGWLCNGSDFPVENIDPVYGFYAAVCRKDLKGFPDDGFLKENAITRIDALKAMTIWAAKSFFEEKEKGSIEPGKYADFVVFDKDILSVPENEIPTAKVLMTFINGEKVYNSTVK
ncbi:MAG: amidohydrolase family protein [Bacteroidota bacterium]